MTGTSLSPEAALTETTLLRQLVDDMMQQRKELMDDVLLERRRDRRHKNVRFALIFGGIALMMLSYLYVFVVLNGGVSGAAPAGPYAAIVQLKGPIADGSSANAVSVSRALTRAFKDPRAAGVVLYVNSPGGSPVQSSIIYDRILALKAEHPEKRIVTVATDTLASGAYFVASATDRIYVNRSTIAGSIGVVSDGFGFTDALKHLGVERRVFTAGENKARLDPFIPLTDADKAKIADVLSEIHTHFIDSVKAGRGDRLSFEAAGLFEGDVWTGNQALEMGLVDALGDLTSVLDQEFGVEHARDYTIKPAFLERIMKYAATTAMDEIHARNQLRIR